MAHAQARAVLVRLLSIIMLALPISVSPLLGSGVARASIPVPEMVSLDSSDNPVTDPASGGFISDNGQYVAFQIYHYDEVTPINAIYVRDRTNDTTTLASKDASGNTVDDAILVAFSGDGNSVVFLSGDTTYVRDISAGTTVTGSLDSNDDALDASATSISDDGTELLLTDSNDHNYLRDLVAETTTQLVDGKEARLSGNGEHMVYRQFCGTPGNWSCFRAWVYNIQTNQSELASVDSNNVPAKAGYYPVISDNGRYVAMYANIGDHQSPNACGAGPCSRYYRHDMLTGENLLADITSAGDSQIGGGGSTYNDAPYVAISGDGNVVGMAFNEYLTDDNTDGLSPHWYMHNFATGNTGLVDANSEGEVGSGTLPGNITYNGSLATFMTDSSTFGLNDDGLTQVFVNATTGTGVDSENPTVEPFAFDDVYTNGVTPHAYPLAVNVHDHFSGVAGGEYFIGEDPGAGNGTAMTLNGSQLTANVPATEFGQYEVSVRARDVAGNWSEVEMAQLNVLPIPVPSTLDNAVLGSISITEGNETTLTVSYTDNDTGVGGIEYYIDEDPGEGSGVQVPFENGTGEINLGSDLTVGAYTVYVRIADWNGNWQSPVPLELTVTAP